MKIVTTNRVELGQVPRQPASPLGWGNGGETVCSKISRIVLSCKTCWFAGIYFGSYPKFEGEAGDLIQLKTGYSSAPSKDLLGERWTLRVCLSRFLELLAPSGECQEPLVASLLRS